MNQEDQKLNTDLDEIDKDISFHRIMIFLIIISVVAFYLIMKEVTVSDKAQHWGPVGDFFGGILNPIFALFAFYWLTYSVRLQIKELKETREELGKAARAQQESAKHQEEIANLEGKNVETQGKILALNQKTLESQQAAAIAQQQQIAIQNFESLFFQLLKAKTEITSDIRFTRGEEEIFIGKEAIKNGIEVYKNSPIFVGWEDYYRDELLDYMGSYFRICYQIVKLIDNNEDLKKISKVSESKEYSMKQKEYFDIFRATLTQYELEAFFFNGLSKYGNGYFKKLIEDYGLFEHIIVESDIFDKKISNKICRFLYFYEKKAFEENEIVEKYFNDISVIREGLTSQELNIIIDKLKAVEFILCVKENYHQIPKGSGWLKDVLNIINPKINFEINKDLFTKKNIGLIWNDSKSKYSQITMEIQRNENDLKRNLDYLMRVKEYFKNKGEDPILDKKVDVGVIEFKSIEELNEIIKECECLIKIKKEELKQLERNLSELKENEYTETVLTIIKYNIDYFQYWEYMRFKEKIEQKKSA